MLLISQHSRHAKLFKYIMTYLPWLNKQCSLIKDIPKIRVHKFIIRPGKKKKEHSLGLIGISFTVKGRGFIITKVYRMFRQIRVGSLI